MQMGIVGLNVPYLRKGPRAATPFVNDNMDCHAGT